MRSLVLHHAIVVAVAQQSILRIWAGPRLWDRDEPRNAGCAAEMLASNDWVTPVFNAELRTPQAGAAVLADDGELLGVWHQRVFGTLLVGGACRRDMHRHLPHRPQVVWSASWLWSALALAASLLFGVSARAATPDSLLVFLCSTAILVYVLGTFRAPHVAGPPR